MNKQDKKDLIKFVGGSIVVAAFVWLGYDTEILKVESCTAKSQKHVTAEFSETICGTDFEGNYSCDTDYWSDKVSDTWTVYTFDGVINETSTPFTNVNGIGIVATPPYDHSAKRGGDFDNFKFHSSNVATTVFTDGTNTEDGLSVYPKCLNSIGNDIDVKTWYGIRYSIQN